MEIERLTTLAFSMYTNKGAYALLLGAGISRSAHIPSGWEVVNILIEKLAATKKITNEDDWHKWYKNKYGHFASYSSLLESLAKTSTERVQLMKGFFEPTEEEKELGWKVPTKAHRAIAKLAKKGYIRVVFTTNFDRLLERALEMEGITPQVISQESDLEKSTPIIHSKTITVIKINGDYIGCNFRNTTEELSDYPESMKNYVRQTLDDYGLITCGWSAEWDKGLINIINSLSSPRYNSFFTTLGETSDSMRTLAKSRNGEVMQIDGADELFSELSEQVSALEKINVSNSISHDMMMSRVKKYLSSDSYKIEFSDLIEKMGTEAYDKIMAKANYNFLLTPELFSSYLEIHHKAVKPLLDAAILSVRWGKSYHIEVFGDILIKLCTKPFIAGESRREGTQYLHSLGATFLLNAIGIACVKYERFTELNKILKLSVPAENFTESNERESLLSLLAKPHWGWDTLKSLTGTTKYYPWSFILIEQLRSPFKGYFTVDSEYENTFYIWEHLESLIYGYNRNPSQLFYVPGGQFLYSRMNYERYSDSKEPYCVFFNSADKLKEEWEPIKQGLFGRSYDQYKNIFDLAEEYYKKTMRH